MFFHGKKCYDPTRVDLTKDLPTDLWKFWAVEPSFLRNICQQKDQRKAAELLRHIVDFVCESISRKKWGLLSRRSVAICLDRFHEIFHLSREATVPFGNWNNFMYFLWFGRPLSHRFHEISAIKRAPSLYVQIHEKVVQKDARTISRKLVKRGYR